MVLRNEGKGKFLLEGIVGDWRDHFEEQSVKEWDRLIDDQFEKTGIRDKSVFEKVKLPG